MDRKASTSVARAWVARSKDAPKKWTTFWYDPDGKQRQKTFETKKRADDQRKRKEQELDAGTYLDDRLGKQPVTAVWEQWTNQRKLENSTKKQYRSIQKTTLEPFFKARSIVSLKVADVEQWLLWMEQDRKLSARTRRQRFSFFSGMMVPIALMPVWLQGVAWGMPFVHFTTTPASIYLGRVDTLGALGLIAAEAAWTVGLWVLARLIWRQLVKKVTIHGG